MAHVLDISGLFLYLIFRVVILPVLAFLAAGWLLISAVQATVRAVHAVRAIRVKPMLPRFRVLRLPFSFSK